jgi:hypothetical protein
MKLKSVISLGALALALGAATLLPAQSSPEIDKALSGMPASLHDEITVVKWKSDFTYETLKQGKGKLVCYDRSGQPLQQPFSVECTSLANLDRVAQNIKLEASGDKAAAAAAVDAAEKDGTRVKVEYGSMFFNYMGPSQDKARHHNTISVPGATGASTGFPEMRDAGGAWLMNAGTPKAHIMLPGF